MFIGLSSPAASSGYVPGRRPGFPRAHAAQYQYPPGVKARPSRCTSLSPALWPPVVRAYCSTYRFEAEHLVERAGFSIETLYDGYRREPFTSESSSV